MNEYSAPDRAHFSVRHRSATGGELALRELAASLAALGDEASRATRRSRDVRLHVIACQAEHLAGEVRTLVRPSPADVAPQEQSGLTAATARARRALEAPMLHRLPQATRASLGWLLLLAEAVDQ